MESIKRRRNLSFRETPFSERAKAVKLDNKITECTQHDMLMSVVAEYNTAVLRAPARTCVDGLTTKEGNPKVDVSGAIAEHAFTMETVRFLGINVHCIPADDAYPDCVFIEDPVFFLDGKAFMPQLGHPTRRGERKAVREFVEKQFPKLNIIEMTGEGFMDGGDICFIGGPKKEILCGVSRRTNEEGVRQLQAAFPDWTVTPIPIPKPTEGGLLHLITMTSRCGNNLLAIGQSEAEKVLRKTLEDKAVSDLDFFTVPDDWASNCIYINGKVLHCGKEEYPESYKAYQERFGDNAIALTNKEFDKIDGSLTCRVRLFNYQ